MCLVQKLCMSHALVHMSTCILWEDYWNQILHQGYKTCLYVIQVAYHHNMMGHICIRKSTTPHVNHFRIQTCVELAPSTPSCNTLAKPLYVHRHCQCISEDVNNSERQNTMWFHPLPTWACGLNAVLHTDAIWSGLQCQLVSGDESANVIS